MRRGVIIATVFLAALIAAGEVEQGTFGMVGLVSATWIAAVALANVPKRKARRGNVEQKEVFTRIMKHSLIIAQSDLHVNGR